jgi:hypothetical protein
MSPALIIPAWQDSFDDSPSKPEKAMHTPPRKSVFLRFAGFLALMAATILTAAMAQSAGFAISQNGHPVGTASFDFAAGAGGYDSASVVRVSMTGLDYALSKTEQLSLARHLRRVQLSATVNGAAVTVTATITSNATVSNPASNPGPAQILLAFSANGRNWTTPLAAHSGAIFFPDFDPGALDTLLTLAAARNNRDLWAIVPKQTGSIEPIALATYADEQGTLDGNPIQVHHLVATIAGATTDLFSGPENQLLQAELPQQGFALVRNGFSLTPPAKPGAPPASF